MQVGNNCSGDGNYLYRRTLSLGLRSARITPDDNNIARTALNDKFGCQSVSVTGGGNLQEIVMSRRLVTAAAAVSIGIWFCPAIADNVPNWNVTTSCRGAAEAPLPVC